MARRARIALKPKPGVLVVDLFLPEASPARSLTVSVNGAEVLRARLEPGRQTLKSAPLPAAPGRMEILLEADRWFRPPADGRELSLVLEALRIE